MEDNKIEKVKKIVKVGVIIAFALLGLYMSYNLTSCVMENSYSTKDVLMPEKTSTTVAIEETTSLDDPYRDEEVYAISKEMSSVDKSDMVECSLKQTSILLSSSISPYYKYMADSSYKIGKVSEGYKIDYIINGEKLVVICSERRGNPVIFIKDEPFSEKEKKFYYRIKAYHEVKTDEGKYSMQIW